MEGVSGIDGMIAALEQRVLRDAAWSGATLDEVARTLKAHGAARVVNWVVARALKD